MSIAKTFNFDREEWREWIVFPPLGSPWWFNVLCTTAAFELPRKGQKRTGQ
jgi:hypothetical protein